MPPTATNHGTTPTAPSPRLRSAAQLAHDLEPLERRNRQRQWVRARLVLADLCVMWCCFVAARLPSWLTSDLSLNQTINIWWTDKGHLRTSLFVVIALGMVGWMWAAQSHYTPSRNKPWWDEVRQILLVVLTAALIDAMVIYLTKWPLSRLWTATTWALIFISLPLARLFMRRRLLRAGLLTQPYVLIGHADDVEKAAHALASEPLLGYRPVAVISPNPHERLVNLPGGQIITPTLLTPAVRQFLAQPGTYQLVGVLGTIDNHWLRELSQELMLTRDDLVIVPALGGLPIYGMEVSHFFSHEVLMLRARNNLNRRGPKLVKRSIDLIGASIGLLLLSPLLVWAAWRIRREDGGPVLFVQPRIGLHGKTFNVIKFRSMVLNADAALERWKTDNPDLYQQYQDSNFKLPEDPRVTRIGAFIRRASIDELPQLINVIKGDMSLVGPRPLLPRELTQYGPSIAAYRKARPGITGLWQISGRSTTTFEHRINMDLWYVRNWSLWYDLVILLRTVRVVLNQQGAH